MRRNVSVTLGSHYDDFIDTQIKTGGGCSRSEVVRAGLSLLEMHQAKIKALKHAIDVGLNSESVECSYENFMAEMDQEDGFPPYNKAKNRGMIGNLPTIGDAGERKLHH